MNLPEDLRRRLTEELRFVIQKMEAEDDPFRKLYFFSAAFGEIGRILNICWDRELALIHLLLQATHQTASQRLAAITEGRERAVRLPDHFYNQLTQLTTDLAMAIDLRKKSDELLEIIAGFAELAYVTTGNGFYLYEKGLLKI